MPDSPQSFTEIIVGGLRLNITGHCVERYQQRFAQALDLAGARRQLEQLVVRGEIRELPPTWLARNQQQEAEKYLLIGEDLVLPLVQDRYTIDRYAALTCIGHGSISDTTRARRNARARIRRGHRHQH